MPRLAKRIAHGFPLLHARTHPLEHAPMRQRYIRRSHMPQRLHHGNARIQFPPHQQARMVQAAQGGRVAKPGDTKK